MGLNGILFGVFMAFCDHFQSSQIWKEQEATHPSCLSRAAHFPHNEKKQKSKWTSNTETTGYLNLVSIWRLFGVSIKQRSWWFVCHSLILCLNHCGLDIPSWKLTYPSQRDYCWWFSFSPDGIFVSSLERVIDIGSNLGLQHPTELVGPPTSNCRWCHA